jgi:predicted nuclease with TOPRIM domain
MPEAVWVAIIVAIGGGASGWFTSYLNKRLNRAHETEEITDMVVKRLRDENTRLEAKVDNLEVDLTTVTGRAKTAEERADKNENENRRLGGLLGEIMAHLEMLERRIAVIDPPPPPRPWEKNNELG